MYQIWKVNDQNLILNLPNENVSQILEPETRYLVIEIQMFEQNSTKISKWFKRRKSICLLSNRVENIHALKDLVVRSKRNIQSWAWRYLTKICDIILLDDTEIFDFYQNVVLHKLLSWNIECQKSKHISIYNFTESIESEECSWMKHDLPHR
jgi:hypothetical protein